MAAYRRDLTQAARLLGSKGGRVTAQRLSPEQRTANARQAVNARWARVRDAATEPEPATEVRDEKIFAMRDALVQVNKKHAEFWAARKGALE